MGTGQISTAGQGSVGASEDFAAAHQALKTDFSVQFSLTRPDPPPQPPQWLKDFLHWLGEVLKPVENFFGWLGKLMPDVPFARFLLWTVLALATAALVALLYQRLRHGQWRLPWSGKDELVHIPLDEEEWAPEAAPVRSWLEEADAMARQGRFAEAIHHLLLRSIEDIARRRPQLVRPALTSRELAASQGIPGAARELFAAIAGQVERSLFGGREIVAADWDSARGAYADFTLAKAWKA